MDAVLKKLRYTGQPTVLVQNAPEEMRDLVSALDASGAAVDRVPNGSYAWSLIFLTSLAETTAVAEASPALIEGDGILWVAYPKGSSKKYRVDVNRDTAWPLFEGTGTRLVAQTAIDDDWSAMRVRRSEYVK